MRFTAIHLAFWLSWLTLMILTIKARDFWVQGVNPEPFLNFAYLVTFLKKRNSAGKPETPLESATQSEPATQPEPATPSGPKPGGESVLNAFLTRPVPYRTAVRIVAFAAVNFLMALGSSLPQAIGMARFMKNSNQLAGFSVALNAWQKDHDGAFPLCVEATGTEAAGHAASGVKLTAGGACASAEGTVAAGSSVPRHSWRVLLLPYLGEAELFARIRLDEPWNSEWNRQFHDQMPAIFRNPEWRIQLPWLESLGRTARSQTTYCLLRTPVSLTAWENLALEEDPDLRQRGLLKSRDPEGGPNSDVVLLLAESAPGCWMDPNHDLSRDAFIAGVNQTPNGLRSWALPFSCRCVLAFSNGWWNGFHAGFLTPKRLHELTGPTKISDSPDSPTLPDSLNSPNSPNKSVSPNVPK